MSGLWWKVKGQTAWPLMLIENQCLSKFNIFRNYLRKDSMYEIWAQLAKWFLRKLCSNMLMSLQYERSKVNLDLWNLFIAIAS